MNLKLKCPLTSIVQVILCAFLSGIAIFTFSKSSLYHHFQALAIIPLMFSILITGGIYASIGGSKQVTVLFTAFLILLCVPTILAFSSWLKLWEEAPIETSLKLPEMLTIAGVITAGHFSFFYLNHFKESKSDLLGRGGLRDEINKCHLKSNIFGFTLILLALLSAAAVLGGSMLLEETISSLTATIPMRMFVIGIGASLIAIAVVYKLIILFLPLKGKYRRLTR